MPITSSRPRSLRGRSGIDMLGQAVAVLGEQDFHDCPRRSTTAPNSCPNEPATPNFAETLFLELR